jgi:hypothetical protein
MGAVAEKQVEQEPKRRGRSPLALVGEIVGVLSGIGGILAAVFLLLPSLQPEPPAREKGGSLSKVTTEPRVTFGQYLLRTGQPQAGFSKAFLDRPGVFVQFNVTIIGYKGKDLPLRWELVDAATGAQVRSSKSTFLRAEAQEDQASWHLWDALPRRRGEFYVLVQLFDDEGRVPLDRVKTETFRGVG